MAPSTTPYLPYADVHAHPQGPGDARPTSAQIVKECGFEASGLRGKTVLITGCSSGTGLETAKALYHAGADVFVTARNTNKLQGVITDIISTSSHTGTPPRLVPLELHLDNLQSVRKAAQTFEEQSNGKLNILINNAGVMAVPFSLTVDKLETHIATNHFGHFLLTHLLLPLLISSATPSKPSRIVNLSSAAHIIAPLRVHDLNFALEPAAYSKFLAYGQSKLANIYHASALNRHYSSRNIVALSVHPGYVESELIRHMDQQDYESLGSQLEQLELEKKNTTQGAATTVWAALSEHFDDVANGGRYLADIGESMPWAESMSPGGPGYVSFTYDEDKEEELWRVSCETVGVTEI